MLYQYNTNEKENWGVINGTMILAEIKRNPWKCNQGNQGYIGKDYRGKITRTEKQKLMSHFLKKIS